MYSQKIKDALYVVIMLAILVFAFAANQFVASFAKSIQPSAYRSFSVSGDGKTTAIPDIAEFTFSVITQGGTDIAKIQNDNTAKVNGAIAFVKKQESKTRISRPRITAWIRNTNITIASRSMTRTAWQSHVRRR